MCAYVIRQAEETDCPGILTLIQELAAFENLDDRVKIQEETLRRDGFGEHSYFKCKVATISDTLVGYALYFPIYSTFEGRALYLEDLYVTPRYRGKGIGSAMWTEVVKEAVESGCCRLDFSVLSWNEKAIAFYKSRGALNITVADSWNTFRMDRSALEACHKRAKSI